MYIPLKLLCLLWWPRTVLGSFQILVQSSSTTFKPGDTITYTLVADPIPSGTLGIILIPVQEGDVGTARPFTSFTAAMAYSPEKFTMTIPPLGTSSFYTIDAHSDTTVYSTLLGASDPFEIDIASTTPTTPTITTTKTTTAIKPTTTTSQTPVGGNPTTKSTSPNTPSKSPSSVSNPPSSPTSTPSVSSSPSVDSANSSVAPDGVTTTTTTNSAAADKATSASSSDASAGGSTSSVTQKSGGTSVGAIAGGVVGGIVILIILILAFLVCRRRRQRRQRDALVSTGTTSELLTSTQPSPSFLPSAGYAQRQFQPNRPTQVGISPFITANRDSPQSSPLPLSSAKSREAFGDRSGPHHLPTVSLSTGYGESIAASGLSQDALRSERERLLTEISALPTGTTTGATANTTTTDATGIMQPGWSGSSVSAVGSEEDNSDASEMRERLEQLTYHVRRLESALDQVSHGYDAPPMYDGSQR